MKQFEHEKIVADLDQRRLGRMAKAGIGVLRRRAKFALAQFAIDEGQHQSGGRLHIRQARQSANFARRQRRHEFGDVKAAVAREAGQKRIGKAELWRLPARREIGQVGCFLDDARVVYRIFGQT